MIYLSLHELLYLSDQNCPNCECALEYDEGILHCPACGKGWDYRNFKSCLNAYKADAQSYINNLSDNI